MEDSMRFVIYFDLGVAFLLFLVWLSLAIFLWTKKKKNLIYLFFFTLFYLYFAKVLDYTLFQFQSLLLLKHFIPDLMLNGLSGSKSINLIPLVTLAAEDLKTSLLNILLFMPFGFGLAFITNMRMRNVVFIGFLCSVGIEFLQFVTGLAAGITFRVADINDVIFNTLGVVIGYTLFIVFVRFFCEVTKGLSLTPGSIWRYIADRSRTGT